MGGEIAIGFAPLSGVLKLALDTVLRHSRRGEGVSARASRESSAKLGEAALLFQASFGRVLCWIPALRCSFAALARG
jgi:hypothetical protein